MASKSLAELLAEKKAKAEAEKNGDAATGNVADTGNGSPAPHEPPPLVAGTGNAAPKALAAFAKSKTVEAEPATPKGLSLGAFAKSASAKGSDGGQSAVQRPAADETENADDDLEASLSAALGEPDGDGAASDADGSASDDESDEFASITAEAFVYPDQPDKFKPEEIDALRNSMADLFANIEDRELVGHAMRNVLQMTRSNPNLADLLLPDDFGAMTRALRLSYNVAVSRTNERKEKRAAKSAASQKRVDDFAAFVGDLDIKL